MTARGIVLLGHLQGIKDGNLLLAEDLAQNLAKGDEAFENFTRAVDDYITKNGLDVPKEQRSEVSPNIAKEIPAQALHLNLKDAGHQCDCLGKWIPLQLRLGETAYFR